MIDNILPNVAPQGVQQQTPGNQGGQGFNLLLQEQLPGQGNGSTVKGGLSEALLSSLMGLQQVSDGQSTDIVPLENMKLNDLLGILAQENDVSSEAMPELTQSLSAVQENLQISRFAELFTDNVNIKELEVVRYAIMGQLTPITGAATSYPVEQHAINSQLAENIQQNLMFGTIGLKPVVIAGQIANNSQPDNDIQQNQMPGVPHVQPFLGAGSNSELPAMQIQPGAGQVADNTPDTGILFDSRLPAFNAFLGEGTVSVNVGEDSIPVPWSLEQDAVSVMPQLQPLADSPAVPIPVTGVSVNLPVTTEVSQRKQVTLTSVIFPMTSTSNPYLSNIPEMMARPAGESLTVHDLRADIKQDTVRQRLPALQQFPPLLQEQPVLEANKAATAQVKIDLADATSSRINTSLSTVFGHEIPRWFFMVIPSGSAQTLWYRNYKLDEKSTEQLVERLVNSDLMSKQNINRIVINGKQAWQGDAQGESND